MSAAGAPTLPPGPRLPRVVQTMGFVFAPVPWMEANRRRYGDAVTFSTLFDRCFVMAYHPDLIRQVFRGPPEQLRAGEANEVLGPLLGERSVLLLDDAEHMRQRKLLLPPFHGARMRAYEETMRDATDGAIDRWPTDRPFALLPEMQRITLDVIARAVFGVEEGPEQEQLKERIRGMLGRRGSRLSLFLSAVTDGRVGRRAWENFIEERDRLTEAIFAVIARRRTEPDLEQREDVLSMLLLAHDEDGAPMTDRELRDELVTLLVAGHETTATGLAWTFELVLRNPRVREKLEAEISEGGHEYTDAVVKESLRIRPVIPGIGRKVRGEPFQLGEHLIPPGVEINPSIAVLHRRADRYPQHERFEPERFLGPDVPDGHSWIPFGGGTRRCLGASFAMFEMRLVVRRVLERTDLSPADPKAERGVRREVTFTPKNGVRVRLSAPPRPAMFEPPGPGNQPVKDA